MIKQDIINHVVAETGNSEHTVREILDHTIAIATAALQSQEPIILRGFGTFKVVERNARTARNIKTGEPIHMAARKVVVFVPGKDLEKV